jgi:hypothetical protein
MIAHRIGQCEVAGAARRRRQEWGVTQSFVHDLPSQRVVFAPGAAARLPDEAARLGLNRVLVIATRGSGARLGARLADL